MKLYDSKMAPNPRRVRIFLAEKGIEVPTVQVDITKGETRKPPYIEKNPLGGLPMLELDDGTCIAETVAICRYFEATAPNPPLMGTDAADQAVVEMWQRRIELELFRNVTGCFQNTHDFFKGRIEQVPAYGEICRKAARATRLAGWRNGTASVHRGPALYDRRHHRALRARLRPRRGHPHRGRAEESRALVRSGLVATECEGVIEG
jgi:glutathione S-transferase